PPAANGASFLGPIAGVWQVPLTDIGSEGNGGKYLVLPPDFGTPIRTIEDSSNMRSAILEALPWVPLKTYTLLLKSLPGANLTVFDFGIRICWRVLGLTPLRAFLSTTLKVPNPTSCTILSFFTPTLTALMTAVTALSASALLVSLPSCFWTASTNSTLFMINDAFAVGC